MKRTISLASLLFLLLLSSCGSSNFRSLKEYSGIEVVHVPRLLCKFASCSEESIVKGVKSIDVASACREEDSLVMARLLQEIIDKEHLELIIEVSDSDESVSIYGHPMVSKEKIKDVIIFSRSNGSSNLVRLKGTFSIDDFNDR